MAQESENQFTSHGTNFKQLNAGNYMHQGHNGP